MTTQQVERGISDIVGALTDPIIVHPGGWGDTLPDWLKTAITLERIAMNVKELKGEEITSTDAEACAYLYTACLCFPFDNDWTDIYLYVTGQVYSRHRAKESDVQVPEDIRVESISDYQMGELRRLKDWIYQKRTQARLDKDRAERHQNKEKETARRKAERPTLFEF